MVLHRQPRQVLNFRDVKIGEYVMIKYEVKKFLGKVLGKKMVK